MRPGVEVGRAHEVADVLQEQVIEVRPREGGKGALHHAHLHVADAQGVQLHRGHAGLLDLEGVHIAFQIGFDNPEVGHTAATQLGDESEQERGLAGARRGHDVHEERTLVGSGGAESVGGLVVSGQDVLLHFDDASLLHDALPRLGAATTPLAGQPRPNIGSSCYRPSYPMDIDATLSAPSSCVINPVNAKEEPRDPFGFRNGHFCATNSDK